ncbi:MAG: hypothetical protein QOK15_1838 [Nocardioidaceae bacterium]|nr:hypothetical protein [Nocardioidaceae bacterium]
MRPFARGTEVPREVRAVVDGRVLAAAEAGDGTWLAGTRDALYFVGPGRQVAWAWEEVQRADWDQDTSRLRVERVTDYGEPVERRSFGLSDPGSLLPLVRERVTASVVLERRVPVVGKRGLRVIGRRPPSGHGDVRWAFIFDPGVDPDDPVVRLAADQALREAQESLGL